ncbi:UPF0132 domain-containing protein [Apiospora saccharicola]
MGGICRCRSQGSPRAPPHRSTTARGPLPERRPPPLASPRGSYDYQRRPNNVASPPPLQHPQPQRQWSASLPSADRYTNNASRGLEAGLGNSPAPVTTSAAGGGGYMSAGAGVSEFDTSLGLRLDYEAAAAYLAIPPVGAIVLLILERSSDYVRLGWAGLGSVLVNTSLQADNHRQAKSCLTVLGGLTLRFKLLMFHAWQSSLLFTAMFILHLIFSWSTFLWWVLLLVDLGLMAFLALRAYEVPIFGQLASRILDDE